MWLVSRPGVRAEQMGAHAVLPCTPDDLVRDVARRMGNEPLMPWSKRPWLQDGPAVVYDTVGSPETLETSLRLLETGAPS